MDNLKPLSPSIDWGHEALHSLVWLAEAWAIAAVGLLIVLVLLAKYTTWDRQFWTVTGDYFTGRQCVRVWLWLRDPVVGDNDRKWSSSTNLWST